MNKEQQRQAKQAAKIAAREAKQKQQAWDKAVARWKAKDAWIETVFVNDKNI